MTRFDTDDERWRAVCERDISADGTFLYAVKTTGIFCRPGCASRLPRRENVRYFADCKDALQAGFRPCKRCTPDAASPQQETADLVRHACRVIASADGELSLHEIATEVHLSPRQLHHIFKKVMGVTPREFAVAYQNSAQRVESN